MVKKTQKIKGLLSSSPRLFTAEEATKTLPLVTAIVADLAPLWQSVNSTRRRVKHLIVDRDLEQGNPYADELAAVEDKLARDAIRIEQFIDELRQIGVEFKGSRNCHVCFPAMLDGRLVYLSWQQGETEVSHWMELDGSFDDRQSLMATPSA